VARIQSRISDPPPCGGHVLGAEEYTRGTLGTVLIEFVAGIIIAPDSVQSRTASTGDGWQGGARYGRHRLFDSKRGSPGRPLTAVSGRKCVSGGRYGEPATVGDESADSTMAWGSAASVLLLVATMDLPGRYGHRRRTSAAYPAAAVSPMLIVPVWLPLEAITCPPAALSCPTTPPQEAILELLPPAILLREVRGDLLRLPGAGWPLRATSNSW
jgi:hypothetical protein